MRLVCVVVFLSVVLLLLVQFFLGVLVLVLVAQVTLVRPVAVVVVVTPLLRGDLCGDGRELARG
ncbi:hypothetical protein GCM10009545_07310 [Saccharopolyspora thermophila]|uniref:Secreted peptide n=1 Tax=Saccharopolyspora thermophila TaxID=89367 RepID=A0ABN1BXT7_9PSEU